MKISECIVRKNSPRTHNLILDLSPILLVETIRVCRFKINVLCNMCSSYDGSHTLLQMRQQDKQNC